MKLSFDLPTTSDAYLAICEVAPMLGLILASDGEAVCVRSREKGLRVFRNADGFGIEASTRLSLLRAVGLLKEHGEEERFDIEEMPRYDLLCAQLENSRNAVLKLVTVKDFIRRLALMGYHALMLYTEDTYEMEGHPYFGHLRGRFSSEEFKQIDDYATLLGIEVIPCIQTLAHLRGIFRWSAYGDCNDTEDILLLDHDKTYRLIEDMIATMSGCFRSRRINIGLDEAHMLGRGRYLDEHGYVDRTELMKRHLHRVCEICARYGYQPMMWSDMFYGLVENKLSADEVDQTAIPDGVLPIAWNYWSQDNREYDEIFRCHKLLDRSIGFAAGTSTWFGMVPLSEFSLNVARSALHSIDRAELKNILVTSWGDDGATCSQYFSLPTMLLFAENCWGGDIDDEALSRRFATCVNGHYEDFKAVERINDVPGRTNYGRFFSAPHRYMLYNDPLTGLYDRHVLPGTAAHFAEQQERMKACAVRNPMWAYLFDALAALCALLSAKAEVGQQIKAAYDRNDRVALQDYAETALPKIASLAEDLSRALTKQWMMENKTTGLEISAIRIGGVAERARQASLMLAAYLEGRLARIDELEAPRLTIDGSDREDDYVFEGRMLWNRMVSVNVQCIYI